MTPSGEVIAMLGWLLFLAVYPAIRIHEHLRGHRA